MWRAQTCSGWCKGVDSSVVSRLHLGVARRGFLAERVDEFLNQQVFLQVSLKRRFVGETGLGDDVFKRFTFR